MRPPAGWWRVCAPRATCPEVCFLLCNHGCLEPAQGASLTPQWILELDQAKGLECFTQSIPSPPRPS